MRSSTKHIGFLSFAVAAFALVGCGDKDIINVVPVNAAVSMQDQCDSASFNAAIGAGTCNKAGNVTFDAFNAELAATQMVAAWRFVPAAFTVRVGQGIDALNAGGEVHTFTEVENFGGGIVPALNTASGNLIMAPECATITAADRVAPGAVFHADAETEVGTEHYQCCIHPWMRATVTVVP